jgi:hypothetical protein
MKLRVEFFWNEDVKHWSFRVPSLRIIGGGQTTREEAEHEVREAIEFALEPLDDEIDDEVDEVAYFDVQVTPARVEAPAG